MMVYSCPMDMTQVRKEMSNTSKFQRQKEIMLNLKKPGTGYGRI